MSFVSDLEAADEMIGISLCDRASVMPLNWARAPIAYTSHCNSLNGVMRGCDFDNLATMARIVAETDNVWHCQNPLLKNQRIAPRYDVPTEPGR